VRDSDSMGGRLMRMWFWLLSKLVLLGALLLVIAVGTWLWFKQERLLFRPDVLPVATVLASASDITETFVEVPGARLSALHLKRAGAKGVVFFLHGNAGNLKTWFINPDLYRQANFDLFMFDYRGYGKSTGEITNEDQLRADVRAAFDKIAPQYAGKKIVVYGRSLGSGLAAMLSADLGHDAKQPQPDLTVLVSPYSSMVALAGEVYPLVPESLLRYPLRTDQVVNGIKSPLLLVHGTADTLIPPSHSATLKALAPKAKVLLVPGAGHNDIQTFEIYHSRLVVALMGL
jgi:uncharacterized protein